MLAAHEHRITSRKRITKPSLHRADGQSTVRRATAGRIRPAWRAGIRAVRIDAVIVSAATKITAGHGTAHSKPSMNPVLFSTSPYVPTKATKTPMSTPSSAMNVASKRNDARDRLRFEPDRPEDTDLAASLADRTDHHHSESGDADEEAHADELLHQCEEPVVLREQAVDRFAHRAGLRTVRHEAHGDVVGDRVEVVGCDVEARRHRSLPEQCGVPVDAVVPAGRR